MSAPWTKQTAHKVVRIQWDPFSVSVIKVTDWHMTANSATVESSAPFSGITHLQLILTLRAGLVCHFWS